MRGSPAERLAGFTLSMVYQDAHEPSIKLTDPVQVRMMDAMTEAAGIPYEKGQTEIEIPKKLRHWNTWVSSEEYLERWAKTHPKGTEARQKEQEAPPKESVTDPALTARMKETKSWHDAPHEELVHTFKTLFRQREQELRAYWTPEERGHWLPVMKTGKIILPLTLMKAF